MGSKLDEKSGSSDFGKILAPSLRYSVVICPKCRVHAQILEGVSTKSTRCQHCGARLSLRKLRVFYSSDRLSEAVAARTRLQAELSGAGPEIFPELSSKKSAALNPEKEEKSVPLRKTASSCQIKNDPKSIILQVLGSTGGMELEALKVSALERGVSPERFEKVLSALLEAGDIYFPSRGKVKIV